MASKPALGSRAASLSGKLRQLSTHIPGLGDRHHQQQQEQQQESEVPEFQITHTPDRPTRLVDPSEAPSEEDCEAEISAWQRLARGDKLALVGNTARERRRTHRLRRMSKVGLAGDERVFGGAGDGSDSEYEDMVVEDYDDGDDGNEEGDGYASLLSQLTTIAQDERQGSLRIDIPGTHRSHRLATLDEKSRGPGSVNSSGRSEASSLSPGEGGLHAARYGPLLSPPSIRASVGYSSDGESYNGEVVEAKRIDVQRLYDLESARRGYCLRCKSHTIARGSVSCIRCGTDFERVFREGFFSDSAEKQQHQSRPGSSSSSKSRPQRRRSAKPGPSPLSREAAFSDARLATLKPLMQSHDSTPTVRLDVMPGVEDYIPEGEISPIKAVFDPPPEQVNCWATNEDVQHVLQQELHIAMMQISPLRTVRNNLAKRDLAPKGQEILRTDEVRSTVPAVDEAMTAPGRSLPVSRNPVSKFHRPTTAKKLEVFEERERGSGAWELDIVALYEKDTPSGHHDEWI